MNPVISPVTLSNAKFSSHLKQATNKHLLAAAQNNAYHIPFPISQLVHLHFSLEIVKHFRIETWFEFNPVGVVTQGSLGRQMNES